MAVYDLDPSSSPTVAIGLDAFRDSMVRTYGKSGWVSDGGRVYPVTSEPVVLGAWLSLALPTNAAAYKLLDALFIDGTLVEIGNDVAASKRAIAQWLALAQPPPDADPWVRMMPRGLDALTNAAFWTALETDAAAPSAAGLGVVEGALGRTDPRGRARTADDVLFELDLAHEDVGAPLIRELCRQWQALTDSAIACLLGPGGANETNTRAFWTAALALALAIDTIGSIYVSVSTWKQLAGAAGAALSASAEAAGQLAAGAANAAGQAAGAATAGFLSGIGVYGLLGVVAWRMLR